MWIDYRYALIVCTESGNYTWGASEFTSATKELQEVPACPWREIIKRNWVMRIAISRRRNVIIGS
jgi:hypothetical protein